MSHMTIDSQFQKGSQSLNFTEIRNYGFAKIRVRIKRDSYKEQSYAIAEIWTTIGWQEAVAWPMTADLECQIHSYATANWKGTKASFVADAERLFAIAAKIAAE